MNKIINKIKSTLDKFMEIVGYNWVGYKVDIKALEKDIKALETCVNLAKEEYESLKNYHNNLASSFNTYKLDNNPNIMRLFEKINTLNNKVDKYINLTN